MFQLLKGIYNTEGNVIRDIRIIGFDVEGDATDFTMIANLANDVDKDGNEHIYNGITAEGEPTLEHPVIEGRLSVNGNVYEDDYNAIKAVFPNLDMSFLGFYLRFADPEVLRVLLANMTTDDGTGITVEQAEALTTLSNWFKNNTTIETFDEFEKFTGVTTLATESFYMCSNLISIKLPKSIKIVQTLCFYQTSVVFDVDLPNLESIAGGAFWMSGISSIVNLGKITVLPDGGNTRGVFKGCKNLVSANLPSSLATIGAYCFQDDTALASVNYDWTKAVAINTNAFYNCTSLAFDELNLPNLTSLGQNAFYGVKIKKLVLGALTALPAATTSTQNYGDKSVLEEVVLPQTLKSIPNGSFYRYTNCVIEDLNLPNLTSLGGGAFNGTKLRRITSLGSVTSLPNNASSAGSMFYNCKELTYVSQEVFDKLTYLASAFEGCSNLVIEELRLPSLTGTLTGAFMGCTIKKIVDLGSITNFFGDGALGRSTYPFGKEYTVMVLPVTLERIDRYAFVGDANMQALIIKAVTPPSLAAYAFSGSKATCPVYVPDESVSAYQTATGWTDWASRIRGIGQLATDNPTLYAEIQQYL